MGKLLRRKDVAELIGVAPITLYRWEKKGLSPAMPRRLERNNELIYTEEDVKVLKEWMSKSAPAVIGQDK